MYDINNLAVHIRRIVSELGMAGDKDKDHFVALALGRAIATTCLQLPTSEVTSVNAYYVQNCDAKVCEILDRLNREYVLDVRLARECCAKWFKFRYNLVYKPCDVAVLINTLAGCSDNEFSPVDRRLLTTGTKEEEERAVTCFDSLIWEATQAIRENQDGTTP